MRRGIADLMRVTMGVPLVTVERSMNIARLMEARQRLPERIPLTAIILKAYAQVAEEFVDLRHVYLRYPWPHLYEYPTSVASMTVEREHEGAPCVFTMVVKNPAAMSMTAIAAAIVEAQTAPVESIRTFARMMRINRLPWIIRRPLWWFGFNVGRIRANHFGTFGLTIVSSLGGELPFFQSPLTSTLNYGVIQPNGDVTARLLIDHRVIDGLQSVRVLQRLEEVLNNEMVAEIQAAIPA